MQTLELNTVSMKELLPDLLLSPVSGEQQEEKYALLSWEVITTGCSEGRRQ